MVRQEKLSFTKIGKKNLHYCRLEIDGPNGKKILIQQIFEFFGEDLIRYL